MLERLKSRFGKKKAPATTPEAKVAQDESQALVHTFREQLSAYNVLLRRFKAGERELAPELEALQQDMLVLREQIAGVTQPRSNEDFQTVHADLESLSASGDVSYHSPAAIDKQLKVLGASVPEAELHRMEAEIAKVSVTMLQLRCKQMKEHTEGNKSPLLMILPKTVVVNGKTVAFTIGNLDPNNAESVWEVWRENKPDLKPFYVTGLVSEDLKNKVWGDHLTAFTSSSLEGSKRKRYQEQVALVQEKLGAGTEIKGDMYLAMVLHYLITGDLLIKYSEEGLMRLHELGKDGYPLSVSYNVDQLQLRSDDTYAYAHAGLGASSVFSL